MDRFLPILLLSSFVLAAGVYVDHGDPYSAGSLPTTQFKVEKNDDDSPLHTTIFAPTTPGDYAVAFFVSGFDGLIPVSMYAGYLNDVAKHGFIVVASDHIWSVLTELGKYQENKDMGFITGTYMRQFYWIQSHLQDKLSTHAPKVTCNFNHTGLFSHSAGGNSVFLIAEKDPSLFKGIVFFEPMSYFFNKPTNFSLPALIVGTQLSTRSFPQCIVSGFGYNHFYKMWAQPPKVLMDVENYGHCDILDEAGRKLCVKTNFCYGGNETSIPAYHSFAQGVTSAFLIASVQGLTDDFRFVTDRNNVPLPLDIFQTDMDVPGQTVVG